jgi:hypothetical protein
MKRNMQRIRPQKCLFDLTLPKGTSIGNSMQTMHQLYSLVVNKIPSGTNFTYSRATKGENTNITPPKFDFSTVPGYKRPRRVEKSYDVFQLIEKDNTYIL